MNTRTLIQASLLSVACAALAVAPSAEAAPTPTTTLQAARLAPQVEADLKRQIAVARAADPGAFQSVRDVALQAKDLDARARGRKAPIALRLHAMGPKALLPMIEMVAFTETEPAFKRDLVEAIGLFKDTRAMPVLTMLLDREADEMTTRFVSQAVARQQSNEAVQVLTSRLTAASGARATAILGGMGDCQREAIAKVLADRLSARPDEATARVIAKSLGGTGNAWAWKTMATRTEESATRAAAARALVSAYAHYTGEARQAASNAVMVVDAPETTALIAAAKHGASADTVVALDALAARFANNPSR